LEEILYLEEELDQRKDKYRKEYAVLSVQTDRRILKSSGTLNLNLMARNMRKYTADCAAHGGGIQLAYSPEVSVLMFKSVEGAAKTCSALLSGLPELNGMCEKGSYQISLKLGLACGEDTLAPGSQRCIRTSTLVKRANQAAWRSEAGVLMMDEAAHESWPDSRSVTRVPIEIDGFSIYRIVPGLLGGDEGYDNDGLNKFLEEIHQAGITTLKYSLERAQATQADAGLSATPVAVANLQLEGYDQRINKNLVYTERLPATGYAERLEVVRRILSEMELALVRLETASTI
jgi:hypothetical protein